MLPFKASSPVGIAPYLVTTTLNINNFARILTSTVQSPLMPDINSGHNLLGLNKRANPGIPFLRCSGIDC